MKRNNRILRKLSGLLICIAALIVSANVYAAGAWVTKSPMPTLRSSPESGVINGIWYVAGGFAGSGATGVVEAYNPATNTWSVNNASMYSYAYQGAAGVINNKLYVVGGWNSSIPQSTLQIYDPVANTWSTGASFPYLYGSSMAGVINGLFYALDSEDGNSGFSNYFYVYDPVGNTWTSKTAPAYVHDLAATAVYNGLLYVLGGRQDGSSYSNIVEAYNPATNSWSTMAPMLTARINASAQVAGGNIYVMGGSNGANLSTVEIYNPVANTWTTGAPMPAANSAFASAVINNVLYVTGGSANTLSAFETSQSTVTGASPVLSWVSGSNSGAIQSSAAMGSTVNFLVIYQDPNALPPLAGYPKIHIEGVSSPNLEIPGSPISMIPGNNQTPLNYIGGVEYVYNYTVTVPPTPAQTYNCWYEAYNSSNFAASGVDLQKFQLTITGNNSNGGNSSLSKAYTYPSFANISQGGVINFFNLTPNAELKIFTPAGNLVQTLHADSSGVVSPWDGTVEGGGKAGSGTYIVRVSDGKGNKTLKLLIVR